MRALAAGVALLPRRVVWALGGMVGRIAWWALASRRRRALDNVRQAFPEWNPQETERIARASFTSFAHVACDTAWSLSLSRARLERWVQLDPRARELAASLVGPEGGAVAVTAHFGNWEILGLAWGALGSIPLSVVAKPLHNPYLDRWLSARREASGNQVIPSPRAAWEIARHLQEGRAVGIVMDQRTPVKYGGVEARFFGRSAPTTKSPASFSLSLGQPVVVVSCVPDATGCYQMRMAEPIYPRPGAGYQPDVLALTQQLNDALEAEIRRAPEHYFWMHNRWG